jgi:hypothetical protein
MLDAIQQNPAALAHHLKKSSFFENKVANCLLLKPPIRADNIFASDEISASSHPRD